jgi:hypothetical protein
MSVEDALDPFGQRVEADAADGAIPLGIGGAEVVRP